MIKLIKTIKQLHYLGKQTNCLMVLTEENYILWIIEFWCKYKGWLITYTNCGYLQIRVGA